MSTVSQVETICEDVVKEALGGVDGFTVQASEMTDWQGERGFRISIVLPDATFSRTDLGEKLLDISVSIRERLIAAGEERFPFVELSSASEIAESLGDR